VNSSNILKQKLKTDLKKLTTQLPMSKSKKQIPWSCRR